VYPREGGGHLKFGGTRYKLLARFGDIPEADEWIFSLDKRGWCLQESILPRRRLLLNGNEMLWQCQQEKYCECGHVYLAEDVKNKSRMAYARNSKFFDQYALPKSYEHWRALVEEYSDRYLTQKTDKLSAISGLAKSTAGCRPKALISSKGGMLVAAIQDHSALKYPPATIWQGCGNKNLFTTWHGLREPPKIEFKSPK
jgi:hypothetical protein